MGAGLIVFVSALTWSLLAWRHRWEARRRGRVVLTVAAPLLLLIVTVLLANSAGLGVKTWVPTPVNSTMGDVAQLIAFDASPAEGERALDVTLYWLALRGTAQNYKVFVHLLGPGGKVVAQQD